METGKKIEVEYLRSEFNDGWGTLVDVYADKDGTEYIRNGRHGSEETTVEWEECVLCDDSMAFNAPGEGTEFVMIDDVRGTKFSEEIGKDGVTTKKIAPYYYAGEVEGVEKIEL